MGRWLNRIKNELLQAPSKPPELDLKVLQVSSKAKFQSKLSKLGTSKKPEEVLPVLSVELIAEANINRKLSEFQVRAQSVNNLKELYLVLQDFAQHTWSLLEKASMSDSYTRRAILLLQADDKNKFAVLENLAELCWRNKRAEE